MTDEPTKASLAAEFPEWEVFEGFNRLWNARIRGSDAPVMVHGEDLLDLRDQIIRFLGKQQVKEYRRTREPETTPGQARAATPLNA